MPMTAARTVIMAPVMMMVVILGQCVAQNTCGDDTGGGDSRVDRLHRATVGIVGGHAGSGGSRSNDHGSKFECKRFHVL